MVVRTARVITSRRTWFLHASCAAPHSHSVSAAPWQPGKFEWSGTAKLGDLTCVLQSRLQYSAAAAIGAPFLSVQLTSK